MSMYVSLGEIMLRLKTPGHERFFQSPGASEQANVPPHNRAKRTANIPYVQFRAFGLFVLPVECRIARASGVRRADLTGDRTALLPHDQRFSKAVARQAVSSVHARTGGFSARQQAFDRGAPFHVDLRPADHVMSCRMDRDQIRTGLDSEHIALTSR